MADAMKLVIDRVEAALSKAENIGTDRVLFGREGPSLWLSDVRALAEAASPPAREEAPASNLIDTLNAASAKVALNPERAAEIRANWTNGEEAPAEGAGELTRGQIINAICNASPFGPDYKHPDLLRMSDAILALRNRTSEPEAGEASQNDYSPRKTLTDPAPATADKLRVDEAISDDRDALGDDRFIYRTTLMGERHIVDAASGFVWFKLPYDYRFTSNAGQLAQAKAFIAALSPKAALNEQPQ